MTELKFSEFSLAPELHHGITDAGFTYCTPIQSKALPLALAGRDVAGQAQTGTGKTAAYLIALYQYLLTHEPLDERQPGPRALILAPTRELAVQIHNDATLLGAHLPFKLGLAFGGTDYEKQKRQLAEGVDVLIGTPGRLIDFFKQGIFGLRKVQVAVLDEADRMFDLGFLRDIRYILRRFPPAPQRLNLLFSATLSYRVLELAYEHMNDPELIRIEPDKLTVDRVRQVIYFPSNEEKLPLLVTLLRQMDAKRTMVFVNTRRGAEHLQNALEQNGILAAALSGDVPQRKRLKLMRDFQAGELPVLIATDVASRGLHVPDVSHVFNYDLPQDPEDYVHRIGRTARAGASGDAISFGCEDYVVSLPDIEGYIGRKIDVGTYDHEQLTEVSVPPRPRRSERRDGRPGGREARSGRRGPPGRRREREGERGEAGAERREAMSGPEAAEERERGDGGERRRPRRRGPRRDGAEAGSNADGRQSRGTAEERRRDSPGMRDRELRDEAPGARRPEPSDAPSAGSAGGQSVEPSRDSRATDESAPRPKRRRRRRARRGSGSQTTPSGGETGATNDRDVERPEHGSTRDARRDQSPPRREAGRHEARSARREGGRQDERGARREGADRHEERTRREAGANDELAPRGQTGRYEHRRERHPEPAAPAPDRIAPLDEHRGDGSQRNERRGEGKAPGLLARLWGALRR